MKIAICSLGFSEFSVMSKTLGKCMSFIIYDYETGSFSRLENTAKNETKASGPIAIRQLKKLGIDAIITWNIGRNAFNQAVISGIPVYQVSEGEVVNTAIIKFKNNQLLKIENYDEIAIH